MFLVVRLYLLLRELNMIIQIEPWIDDDELVQLKRVVDSTFVVEHKLTSEFEEMTKQLTGSTYAIALTNGTMALFAALKALGVGYGDEVIVPNLTFVATANAAILAGAKVSLCDVEQDTMMMNLAHAEKLITSKTKVIIPVHLYGQSMDMEAVVDFAKKRGLKVLEDAAQGVGVRFKGRHTGTFGDMGILSYYGNKTITCGEGGVVLTNSPELANYVYRLKNHGRDRKGTFIHEHIGFNFSFTEMQAAIGISQMNKLNQIIKRKKEIRDTYENELKNVIGLDSIPLDIRSTPVFWFTSFLVEKKERLIAFLAERGVQTRQFFYPLHKQPCYLNSNHVTNMHDDFPVSEHLYARGMSLPSAYSLSEEEQKLVISSIKEFYDYRN